MNTHQVVQKLGIDRIASAVGVKATTVKEARRVGAFPASWFLALRSMADADGLDLPERLFSWKTGDSTPAPEAPSTETPITAPPR